MPLQGAFRLFRVAGINVFLHWSWFVVAIYEIQSRRRSYSSPIWNVLEYLALFLIVLTHEFGHALACRQVGGTADRIMLWPFGGVAYVSPPQRPGATLWSIAAGPLVNVALLPIFWGLFYFAWSHGWAFRMHDEYIFVRSLFAMDFGLLIFNILPIYPLDGGQILRSLLWFVLGRARSLLVATVLGFVGIAGLIVYGIISRSTWTVLISVYLLLSCWGGLKQARQLLRVAKIPRRLGFACPGCHTAPPLGTYWNCSTCGLPFDTFEHRGTCPNCSTQYPTTICTDCRESHPMAEWATNPAASGATINGTVVNQPR